MRRLCATALTVSLCAHPLLAEGPLARSATGQAARLAGDVTPPSAATDRWKAVRLLEPPAAIVSRPATAPCRNVRRFWRLDDHRHAERRGGVHRHRRHSDDREACAPGIGDGRRARCGRRVVAGIGSRGGIGSQRALSDAVRGDGGGHVRRRVRRAHRRRLRRVARLEPPDRAGHLSTVAGTP